jgi:hypothetical protein
MTCRRAAMQSLSFPWTAPGSNSRSHDGHVGRGSDSRRPARVTLLLSGTVRPSEDACGGGIVSACEGKAHTTAQRKNAPKMNTYRFLAREVLRRTRLFSACHQNACFTGDPAVTVAATNRRSQRHTRSNFTPSETA